MPNAQVICFVGLDMLQIWIFPPDKRSLKLRISILNTKLPHKNIGRSGPDNLILPRWPPMSPDMIYVISSFGDL